MSERSVGKIKVGLIGAGYIGMVHLEVLRRIAGAEVVAVADSDPERARAASETYGIPKVHPDAEGLVADPDVEVVHNCTSNNKHFDLNKAALE
ncbi:MAG TPA: Gfo/Idh/MocA family oxidoreductase, partial [Acidobacteriota bacterium]|nr:Gfo/Idh/MocA family oxidoreductase [Acidobacteriota bacterium]